MYNNGRKYQLNQCGRHCSEPADWAWKPTLSISLCHDISSESQQPNQISINWRKALRAVWDKAAATLYMLCFFFFSWFLFLLYIYFLSAVSGHQESCLRPQSQRAVIDSLNGGSLNISVFCEGRGPKQSRHPTSERQVSVLVPAKILDPR